jgi:N-methylhydantoinase A
MHSRFVLGVDIGGTFTDCTLVDRDGRVYAGKSPTTPLDLSIGFFESIASVVSAIGMPLKEALAQTARICHGTTTGLNALVTGAGATTVLLTSAGHADALRIMNNRGRTQGASARETLDWSISSHPDPIVPADRVIEVNERIDSFGAVVCPLLDAEIDRVLERVATIAPEAIAICCLWSFANPEHEQRLRSALRDRFPHIPISCSFEIAPRIGLYPRMVTTVMNAMLVPLMKTYVARIEERAAANGFTGGIFFVQNEGGLVPAAEAAEFPIMTLKSGPVAGVVGAGIVGMQLADPDIIVADMGGTTFDVGVIRNGLPGRSDESVMRRQQLHLRSVDVDSVGAGGGSIAWVDERTHTLRVGPRSAGARPGPICYDLGGTEVTVTDADLVLGVLDDQRPLAGGLKLNRKAAEEGLAKLGAKLGMDAVRCAAGIVEVVDSLMEDLIRRTTVQRGLDPRDFSLWVYGGASGAHAGLFSRHLQMKRVVLPMGNVASVWSAAGCALLQQRREFSTSVYLPPPWDLQLLAKQLEELAARSDRYAGQIGLRPGTFTVRRSATLKYGMQVHEIEVEGPAGAIDGPWATGLRDAFEVAYEDMFGAGSGYSGTDIIITGLRAVLEVDPPPISVHAPVIQLDAAAARGRSTRPVFWRELDGWRDTAVWQGHALPVGKPLAGPAIVEYPHTTLVVRPEQTFRLDEQGNIVLEVGKA